MKPEDWRIDPRIMRARRSGEGRVESVENARQGVKKEDLIQPLAVWPILDNFGKQPFWKRKLIIVVMIMFVGAVDYMTGYEASVAFLYVIPVFLAGWSVGVAVGLASAFGASATLILTNWQAGQPYSETWILMWNILVRGGTFAVLAILASNLREQMERVHRLSLSDTLTSAWNRRAFYQAFAVELARVARTPAPISLVYIDVDDFKAINDRFGHSTGDKELKAVADICTRNLRLQDTLARLGGDEFAILMPDTHEAALEGVLERLQEALRDGTRSTTKATFSMGGVTFMETPASVNWALHQADELMLRVKSAGKDHILRGRYPPHEAGA